MRGARACEKRYGGRALSKFTLVESCSSQVPLWTATMLGLSRDGCKYIHSDQMSFSNLKKSSRQQQKSSREHFWDSAFKFDTVLILSKQLASVVRRYQDYFHNSMPFQCPLQIKLLQHFWVIIYLGQEITACRLPTYNGIQSILSFNRESIRLGGHFFKARVKYVVYPIRSFGRNQLTFHQYLIILGQSLSGFNVCWGATLFSYRRSLTPKGSVPGPTHIVVTGFPLPTSTVKKLSDISRSIVPPFFPTCRYRMLLLFNSFHRDSSSL